MNNAIQILPDVTRALPLSAEHEAALAGYENGDYGPNQARKVAARLRCEADLPFCKFADANRAQAERLEAHAALADYAFFAAEWNALAEDCCSPTLLAGERTRLLAKVLAGLAWR